MFHVEVWDGQSWVRVGEGHRTYAQARQWQRRTAFGRPTRFVCVKEFVVGVELSGPQEPLERAS